jgi:OOP family OmpA-OmpF porin
MFNKTLLALSLAGLTGMTVAHADSHTLDTTATDDTGYAATTTTDNAAAYAAPVGTGEFTDDRWYAAPFGTFVQPGGDRNAQGGWGAGLALGKIINEYFNVEVRGFWQNWGNNGVANIGRPAFQGQLAQGWADGGTDLTGGTIDLQYYFLRDTFSPYAVFALGGVNNSWRGSSVWAAQHTGNGSFGTNTASFIFEAGAGATWELADNFLLRGDVRYRGDTAAGDYYNNIHGVGSNT